MKARVMHTVCGGVAFLYERKLWISGSTIILAAAAHSDLLPMRTYDPVTCDHCHAPLHAWEFEVTLKMEPRWRQFVRERLGIG